MPRDQACARPIFGLPSSSYRKPSGRRYWRDSSHLELGTRNIGRTKTRRRMKIKKSADSIEQKKIKKTKQLVKRTTKRTILQ